MLYVNLLDEKTAKPEGQEILNKLKSKFGKIPNIYKAMSNSPVALKSLLEFRETLSKASFNPKEIETIALVTGEENSCGYCLAAHSAIAKSVGLKDEEVKSIRAINISDAKLMALADLTKEIVRSKGNPCKGRIEAFLNVGYSKEALIDLVAWVSLNIFTNYFNHIFETDIDFPKVSAIK